MEVQFHGVRVLMPDDEPMSSRAHLTTLVDAWEIQRERGKDRAEIWKRSGINGQAFHIMSKAERIFDATQRGQMPSEDDALDLINYAAFLLRLLDGSERSGENALTGEWPWRE